MKSRKIRSEEINNITLSICKAYILWDVVAEGTVERLEEIKDKLDLDSEIIEEGVFGNPIIVVDTSDSKEDIECLFKEIKKMIEK